MAKRRKENRSKKANSESSGQSENSIETISSLSAGSSLSPKFRKDKKGARRKEHLNVFDDDKARLDRTDSFDEHLKNKKPLMGGKTYGAKATK